MIVELGRVNITIQELLDLSVGDVLQLESWAEGELTVLVGQREKFACKPGLSGKRLAVQITQKLSKGDEDDD